MKYSSTIILVCLIIILVSINGFINNFGYPGRSIITTVSSLAVAIIGFISVYGMLSKKKWAHLSFVAWMGYGAVNNFIYYLMFKTRPVWVPIVAAVIIFIITVPIMKKIEHDISGKDSEENDKDE